MDLMGQMELMRKELERAKKDPREIILGVYWGYIGIMENKMETTVMAYVGIKADVGEVPSLDAESRRSEFGAWPGRVNRLNPGSCLNPKA